MDHRLERRSKVQGEHLGISEWPTLLFERPWFYSFNHSLIHPSINLFIHLSSYSFKTN